MRTSLGAAADGLLATRDRIGLDPERVAVDVHEFDTLVAGGRLEEAVALCAGELLPGSEEEWAIRARDAHRERLASDLRSAAAPASRPSRGRVPLVGRRGELATLREAWQQAQAGSGDVVLLRGAAGIGKTRLVAELCDETAEAGAVVAVGAAVDLSHYSAIPRPNSASPDAVRSSSASNADSAADHWPASTACRAVARSASALASAAPCTTRS